MYRMIRKRPRAPPLPVTILAFLIGTLLPVTFGLETTVEFGIILAFAGFVGKIAWIHTRKDSFLWMLLIVIVFTTVVIGIGVVFPFLNYQSFVYFGVWIALGLILGVGCVLASAQYFRIK